MPWLKAMVSRIRRTDTRQDRCSQYVLSIHNHGDHYDRPRI